MTSRFAMAAALLLAGCGGGGTGNVSMDPATPSPGTSGTPGTTTPAVAPTRNALNGRIDKALTLQDSLSTLSQTTNANLPISGSSTFAGSALMAIDRGTTSYSMVGNSRLNVNFKTQTMTGAITNVEGRRADNTTFAAPGKITYGNAAFGDAGQAGLFTVDYAGNLKVDNDTISMSGKALGAFKGNRSGTAIPPQGIQAVDGTTGTAITKETGARMTAKLNGAPAAGQIAITGKN